MIFFAIFLLLTTFSGAYSSLVGSLDILQERPELFDEPLDISSFVTKENKDVPHGFLSNLPRLTTCGGVLDEPIGIINFKLDQDLNRVENCVWTLNAKNRTGIRFQLLQDGFNRTNPKINIFGIQLNALDPLPRKYAELHADDRDSYTVAQRLIFVQFASDYSGAEIDHFGTGFSLLYEETGTVPTGETHVFMPHDSTEFEFSFEYSQASSPWNRNDVVTFTIHPPANKSVVLSVESNVTQSHQWVTRTCNRHLLNVHELGYRTTFQRLTFCRPQELPAVITSPAPVVVSLINWTSDLPENSFKLSWVMEDANCVGSVWC